MYRLISALTRPLKQAPRLIMLALVLVAVSGCSTLGLKAPWNDEPSPDYNLIASNLVNSLAQFPHLTPSMATVQVTPPDTDFKRQVQEELEQQGYRVEVVEQAEGINLVRPVVKRHDAENAEQNLYVLNIGQASAERAYAIVAGATVPVTELVIRGLDQRKVTLNDDIFEAPNSAFTAVAFKPYTGPQIEDVLAAKAPPARARSFFSRNKPTVVKRNLYETLTSHYASVFEGYEDIDQSVLVFPNDSLRLGDANKLIIERYVAAMDPETDLVSVIGCSHGNTEINNGNSLLALGRANRVKEALLFSGLQHDQILEEGCWAPQTFDEVMPRRGVVLTLKRQKNS